jgi:hypothetical protein
VASTLSPDLSDAGGPARPHWPLPPPESFCLAALICGYMAVGCDPLYCNNLAELDSGAIFVTNSTHDAVLEVYGMSNFQEYLAGTNPTNTASCLRITSAGSKPPRSQRTSDRQPVRCGPDTDQYSVELSRRIESGMMQARWAALQFAPNGRWGDAVLATAFAPAPNV